LGYEATDAIDFTPSKALEVIGYEHFKLLECPGDMYSF
jgi:hypothetical protein